MIERKFECYDYNYYRRQWHKKRRAIHRRHVFLIEIFCGTFFKFWVCCGILGVGGASYHWTTDLLVYAVEKKQRVTDEDIIRKQKRFKDLIKNTRL